MGRPKGSKNKRTKDVIEILEEKFPGYNPVAAMAALAHDDVKCGVCDGTGKVTRRRRCDHCNGTGKIPVPLELQAQMHREVAQYIAPKRRAVEMSGSVGTKVKLVDLTGKGTK